MKWQNHKLTSGCFAYAIGLSIPGAIVIALSSVLPDLIETPLGFRGPRLMRHRGNSHDFMLWVGLFFLCWIGFPVFQGYFLHEAVPPLHSFSLALWMVPLGGIFHLMFGDLVTPMGVQILGKKIAAPIFKTGSAGEYLYSLVFVAVCIGMRLLLNSGIVHL